MAGKTMLFEIILTTASIVGLYESWNYLNGANIENYSQVDFLGFALLMISGTMFAIGFIYLLGDMAELFRGKKGD
jgi:cytochrome bd-type quinol oxidase subunit 1